MRRHDLLVAALALAACAAAFGLTYRFSATAPAALVSLEGMGAEFFPRMVIGVIAVLAACIGMGIGNPASPAPPAIPGAVWLAAGALAAYVLALELLGMWLSSFVLMVGLGLLFGGRRLARLALASGAVLAVIWLVFVKTLKGGFPAGLIERLWT